MPRKLIDSKWGAAAFAVGTLGFGMISAWLSFSAAGNETAAQPKGVLPPVWPPPWVFWVVWIIIYPLWGVATWRVWRKRADSDVRGALILYALNLIGALLFLPIGAMTSNNPAVLTLLDVNGLIGAYALAWLYSRYDKVAMLLLGPYLIWMPLTSALKFWLWALNS